MRCGRSRASLLWRSLLVSRGVPVPVCCGVPLPLSFLSGASYSAMAPPASSLFATAYRPVSSSAAAPISSIFPMALRCSAQAGLQLRRCAQAINIFPMALCRIAPGQQLRHGALASNKPHPAEKSTPVWLAIWRTWAGFANSQLRCATFRSTY